jgi:uncharacterized protein YndB with AHSA1/START domain
MSPDYPLEVTVTFENEDGKTKLTLKHAGLPAEDQGEREGWSTSLDKLAEALAHA